MKETKAMAKIMATLRECDAEFKVYNGIIDIPIQVGYSTDRLATRMTKEKMQLSPEGRFESCDNGHLYISFDEINGIDIAVMCNKNIFKLD